MGRLSGLWVVAWLGLVVGSHLLSLPAWASIDSYTGSLFSPSQERNRRGCILDPFVCKGYTASGVIEKILP